MHGAGNVQRHVREEQQQARELVGDVFHGIEVAGVDQRDDVATLLRRIGHIEFLVARGEALDADAEDLLLDRVDDMRALERINLVQGILQALAHAVAVGRVIFQAVGNPEVVQHHVVELFADALRDFAARDAMANPEITHVFLGRGNREALFHHGVAEQRGVEVDAVAMLFGPSDPRLEMLIFDLVAIDPGVLVGENGIACVQVDALLARNEAARLLEVGGQLLKRAGTTGIVARGHNAARCRIVFLIKAHNVIALPAIDRNGLAGELLENGFSIDALRRVCLACQFVGCAHVRSYLMCSLYPKSPRRL